MFCHQIISGAVNDGNFTFCNGNIDGYPFVAYGSGNEVIILDKAFNQIQVVSDAKKTQHQNVVCLDCSKENGTIVVSYGSIICILDVLHQTPTIKNQSNYQFSWKFSQVVPLNLFVFTISLYKNKFLAAGSALTLWELKSDSVPDTEESDFMIGEDNETEQSIVKNGDKSIKQNWCQTWEKVNIPNNVTHIEFSPDGQFFASRGKDESSIHIWYAVPNLGFDSVSLQHPSPVLFFEWRQTSHYMPEGTVANCLMSTSVDGFIRVWRQESTQESTKFLNQNDANNVHRSNLSIDINGNPLNGRENKNHKLKRNVHTIANFEANQYKSSPIIDTADETTMQNNVMSPIYHATNGIDKPGSQSSHHKLNILKHFKHFKQKIHSIEFCRSHVGKELAGKLGTHNQHPHPPFINDDELDQPTFTNKPSGNNSQNSNSHLGFQFIMVCKLDPQRVEKDVLKLNPIQENFNSPCPIVPHWLNNKEFHFTLRSERILLLLMNRSTAVTTQGSSEAKKGGAEMTHDTDHHQVASIINSYENNVRTLSKSASFDSTISNGGGQPGPRNGHSTNYSLNASNEDIYDENGKSAFVLDKQVIHEIELLLRDWHKSVDLLYAIHPQSRDLLIWKIEWLDCQMISGLLNQPKITLVTNMVQAMMPKDCGIHRKLLVQTKETADFSESGRSLLFADHSLLLMDHIKKLTSINDQHPLSNTPLQSDTPIIHLETEVWSQTYFDNFPLYAVHCTGQGTLSLWMINYMAKESEIPRILNTELKAQVYGHTSKINALISHPTLPLLLSASEKECIIWRMESLGPLGYSGGLSQLFVQKFPSPTQDNSNDDKISDDRANKIPFMYIWLPPIYINNDGNNINHLSQKNIFSINFARMDPNSFDVTFFHLSSNPDQNLANANLQAFAQLNLQTFIPNLKQAYIKLLHVFEPDAMFQKRNDPLYMNMLSNLTQNVDYYIVLVVFLDSSPQNVQPGLNNINGSDEEMDSGYYIYVWTLNLFNDTADDSTPINFCGFWPIALPMYVDIITISAVDALDSPYSLVIACSDATVRFLKCVIDPYTLTNNADAGKNEQNGNEIETGRQVALIWREWNMPYMYRPVDPSKLLQHRRGTSSIKLQTSCVALAIAPFYDGRICCIIPPNTSLRWRKIGSLNDEILSHPRETEQKIFKVLIFECESSGGSDWILEDKFTLPILNPFISDAITMEMLNSKNKTPQDYSDDELYVERFYANPGRYIKVQWLPCQDGTYLLLIITRNMKIHHNQQDEINLRKGTQVLSYIAWLYGYFPYGAANFNMARSDYIYQHSNKGIPNIASTGDANNNSPTIGGTQNKWILMARTCIASATSEYLLSQQKYLPDPHRIMDAEQEMEGDPNLCPPILASWIRNGAFIFSADQALKCFTHCWNTKYMSQLVLPPFEPTISSNVDSNINAANNNSHIKRIMDDINVGTTLAPKSKHKVSHRSKTSPYKSVTTSQKQSTPNSSNQPLEIGNANRKLSSHIKKISKLGSKTHLPALLAASNVFNQNAEIPTSKTVDKDMTQPPLKIVNDVSSEVGSNRRMSVNPPKAPPSNVSESNSSNYKNVANLANTLASIAARFDPFSEYRMASLDNMAADLGESVLFSPGSHNLFESLFLAGKLPQYHPKQLVELLGCGQIERVVLILGYLTRYLRLNDRAKAAAAMRSKAEHVSLQGTRNRAASLAISTLQLDSMNLNLSEKRVSDTNNAKKRTALPKKQPDIFVKLPEFTGDIGYFELECIPPLPLFVLQSLSYKTQETAGKTEVLSHVTNPPQTPYKGILKQDKSLTQDIKRKLSTSPQAISAQSTIESSKSNFNALRRRSRSRTKSISLMDKKMTFQTSSSKEDLHSDAELGPKDNKLIEQTSMEELEFGRTEIDILTQYLTKISLPLLTAQEQMQLLALADTIVWVMDQARLDRNLNSGTTKIPPTTSTEENFNAKTDVVPNIVGSEMEVVANPLIQPESLDGPGLRYCIALRQFNYVNRSSGRGPIRNPQNSARFNSLSASGLGGDAPTIGNEQSVKMTYMKSSAFAWAFHSNSQKGCLSNIPIFQKGNYTWLDFKRYGCGWWVKDPVVLTSLIESIGRQAFQANKNALDAALFYIILNKKAVLQGLFRSVGEMKMYDFFRRDFVNDMDARKAASKNAFALLGKHKYELAVAFFLLSQNVNDAIQVCLKNLKDLQLALVICRLFPVITQTTEDGQQNVNLMPTKIETLKKAPGSLIGFGRRPSQPQTAETFDFNPDAFGGSHPVSNDGNSGGNENTTNDTKSQGNLMEKRDTRSIYDGSTIQTYRPTRLEKRFLHMLICADPLYQQIYGDTDHPNSLQNVSITDSSDEQSTDLLSELPSHAFDEATSLRRGDPFILSIALWRLGKRDRALYVFLRAIAPPKFYKRSAQQPGQKKLSIDGNVDPSTFHESQKSSPEDIDQTKVVDSSAKKIGIQKVLPSSDSSNSLDLKDNLTNGHINGQDTEVVPRKKRHSNVRFQDASAIATENGIADKPTKSSTSGKYGRRRASSITETREAPSSFFLSIDRLYDITSIFNFYSYLRKKLAMLNPNSPIAMYPNVLSTQERHLYFACAYTYIKIGCPMLALQILEKLSRKQTQEMNSLNAAIQSWNSYSSTSAGSPILPSNNDTNNFTDESQSTELTPTIPARDHTLQSLKWLACLCLLCQGLVNTFGNTDFCEADLIDSEEEGSNDHNGKKSPRSDKGQRKESIVYDPDTPSSSDNESTETNESPQIRTKNGKILSSFNERLNRKMVKTRESTLRVWLRFYIWLQGEIQAISQFCCPNDFAINQTSIHLAIVETLYDFICLRRPIGMLAFAKMQLLTILNDKLINDDFKTLEVEQCTNQNYNNVNSNSLSETEKDSDIGIINSLPPLLVHRIICPTFSHSNKNINSSTTTNATLFFEDPFEYLQNTCFDIMKGLTSFAATKGVYDSALGTEKGTSTSSQQGANNVKESPLPLVTNTSPPASASITEQNTNALLSTILCLQDTAHSLSACLFQALTPLNMWCEKKLLHLRVKKISDQYQRNARPSKADILKQMKNWHTTTKDSGKKSAITVTQTDEMKNIDCGEDLPCVYVTKDFLEAVCVGEFDVILNFWWQNFGTHLHAENAISEKAPINNESMMITPKFYKLNILDTRDIIAPQKLVMNFNQDDSNYYHQQNLLGNIVFVTPTNSERREPDNHQSTQLNSPTNDAINQMTLDDLANCTEIKNWPDIHSKKGSTKGLSTAQASGSTVLESSSQELKLFLAECLLAIHGSCFITALLTYDACLLYRLVCLKLDSHLWNTTFGFTLHGFMPIQIRQSAQPNAPEMNNQENNENVFDEDTSTPDGETSASNDGKRNSTDINHKIKFWMPPVKPLFATIFQKPSEKNGLPLDILDYDSDVGLDDEDDDGNSIPNSPVFSPLSKSNESLASSFTSNNDSIMGDDEMQHSNPHSFTWTLIKLACIRAMLAEISSFLATILLGPRSLTSTDSLPCRTSPRIHAYICMLEDWEKTLAKRLYNFFERSPNHSQIDPLAMLRISEFGDSSYANIVNENSPPENDNNVITKNPNQNNKNFWSKTQNTQHLSNANGGDNGNRLNQIYQDLLDPNHTPFTSNSRSVIPIKRLWLRLVRDERTHHLFVRFIIKAPLLFAPKSPQTMNNSQTLPSSDQKTIAKTSLDSKGEKAIMTPIVEINPPDIEEIEISGETKYIAKGSFAKIAGKNDSSHNLVDSQMILSLLHKDKESVYAFALKSNRSFDFHAKEYLGDEGKKESEFFSQAEEYYYYPRLNEIGLASDRDIQELDIHQVLNSSQHLSNFVSTPTTGYSKGFLGKRNSHADEIDYPIIPSTNSSMKYSDSFYLDKEMGLPKIHSGPRRLMNGVRKMASHPSQDFYLTGDIQGCIKVWRWEEPHFLEQFNYEARSQLSTPKDILQHRITALKYSPYGYKIGALHANGQMLLYNSSLESYLHSNHEFWKIQAFDGGTDFKFLASESVLGICGLSNRGGLSNLAIYDTLLPDHVSCVQSFCLSDDMGSSAAQNVSQEPHSSSYSPILPTVLCYLPSNPNIIFVATQRGNVQVLDLRYSNSSLHSTTAAQSTTPIHKILNAIKCHETPIKCMALDQSNEQFLVTGSSGGNIKVWSLPHILSPGSSVASEHTTGSGYNSQQHRLSAALGLQNSSNPVVSTFKPTASQPLLFTFNGVHSGLSHSQSANTPLINATASRIKASAAKLKMSSGGLNSSSASVPNLMNDLARLGGCSQLFVDDKARIYSCGMDGSFKIRTLPLMVDNEF